LVKLDQLHLQHKATVGPLSTSGGIHRGLLHRDVYICEWLSSEGSHPPEVSFNLTNDFAPVLVRGAGRPLGDDGNSPRFLNIGILHVPPDVSTLAAGANNRRLATLTLLPPEPHILLPLLLRLAEAEVRAVKRLEAKLQLEASSLNPTESVQKQLAKITIPVDDAWKNDFRAYLFRIPPYYTPALRRCLRAVLPSNVHSLLNEASLDTSLPLQCYSKVCLQKIRNAEQVARDIADRMEQQELGLKLKLQASAQPAIKGSSPLDEPSPLRYGQFDPRSSKESYLAALRSMPSPWSGRRKGGPRDGDEKSTSDKGKRVEEPCKPMSAATLLGDLPIDCLMAYYESRRRWIFGGTGLTTRGVVVEGVNNDGSNSQIGGPRCDPSDESIIALAGVGVASMNDIPVSRMGEYRERVLFSRAPVVGYGFPGISATTATDGSSKWSVDDDALPLSFFDPNTGEFVDSVQARIRAKLQVNFGNPYRDKRADSLVPLKYADQVPSFHKRTSDFSNGSPRTPPGSPPHDSFDSVEEGEAVFVRTSPKRTSPRREESYGDDVEVSIAKRQKPDAESEQSHTALSALPPTTLPAVLPPTSQPTSTSPNMPAPRPLQRKQTPPLPQAKSPKGIPPPPPRPPPPRPPSKPGDQKPPAKVNVPDQAVEEHSMPQAKERRDSISAGAIGTARPPPPPPPQATITAQPGGTNTTQATSSVPEEAQVGVSAQSAVSNDDLQNSEVPPNVDLPAHWICVWSKSQKRWYFFNKKDNKSVWKWPP
jgi:hypothetical protein